MWRRRRRWPIGSRRSRRSGRSRSRSPRSSPTATTASRRTAPATRSSAARSANQAKSIEGQLPAHRARAAIEAPPSYFLIRGDPNAKGSLMKPGFVTVATYGNPPTEIPPADGRTSGRRRALAEWLASPRESADRARDRQSHLAPPFRPRHRRRRSTTSARWARRRRIRELLDWLAVEFMNRGWSIKQMHRLIMTSEAYQMASAFEDAADREKDPREPVSVALPVAAARRRDRARQRSWRRAAAST